MARMHRRGTTRRRYERKIEHRQWFTKTGFHTESVTASTAGSVSKIVVDPLRGDDQTILRTRGIVAVEASALSADTNAVLGAIVLPNKTANNASASELPNPFIDTDTTNWFVWHPFNIPSGIVDSGSLTGADQSLLLPNQMPIDSKAKRIMEASESVVWVIGLMPKADVSNKNISIAYTIRSLVGY